MSRLDARSHFCLTPFHIAEHCSLGHPRRSFLDHLREMMRHDSGTMVQFAARFWNTSGDLT